jgi:hypothetical protein
MRFTPSSLWLLPVDPDQVPGGCRVHDAMVKGWQVKPHRQDPVTTGLSLSAARAKDRSRSWSLGTVVPGPK